MIELLFPRCAAIGYASECAYTFFGMILAAMFLVWYLWIGMRVVHGQYVWIINGLILGEKRPKQTEQPK